MRLRGLMRPLGFMGPMRLMGPMRPLGPLGPHGSYSFWALLFISSSMMMASEGWAFWAARCTSS